MAIPCCRRGGVHEWGVKILSESNMFFPLVQCANSIQWYLSACLVVCRSVCRSVRYYRPQNPEELNVATKAEFWTPEESGVESRQEWESRGWSRGKTRKVGVREGARSIPENHYPKHKSRCFQSRIASCSSLSIQTNKSKSRMPFFQIGNRKWEGFQEGGLSQ